ncbi:MAG: hypothetical protein IJW17_07175 [Lentisphaeria bacterium]|nr:hypothetical protein [Lentisphaeria bacterium]
MKYIPEPVPAKSSVEITAFYYPGTEKITEWNQVEQTLPEIKPLLGWYDESNPEVIDWQSSGQWNTESAVFVLIGIGIKGISAWITGSETITKQNSGIT